MNLTIHVFSNQHLFFHLISFTFHSSEVFWLEGYYKLPTTLKFSSKYNRTTLHFPTSWYRQNGADIARWTDIKGSIIKSTVCRFILVLHIVRFANEIKVLCTKFLIFSFQILILEKNPGVRPKTRIKSTKNLNFRGSFILFKIKVA